MTREEYIEKLGAVIVKLADVFDIDFPSAVIAQACLETGFGTSDKVEYNNHFGLKYKEGRVNCNSGYFTGDTHEQIEDGSFVPTTSDFYAFASLEDSCLGYFQFTSISRYDNLKTATSSKHYLELIQADGYATDKDYAKKCYTIVEQYGLTNFDEELKSLRGMNSAYEDDSNKSLAITAKVCIDAGHYGKYNRSPGIPEYYESDMTWKLSQAQAKYLKEFGVDVIHTRDEQAKDLALHDRGMKSKGCQLFISNHSNAVGSGMNESVDYVAAYHLVNDDTTDIDEISKRFAEKVAPIIAGTMTTVQGYKVLSRKADNDRNGDGILNDNYYGVLHGARMANTPGLILEHSFHTNSRAVRWLLNDENIDMLAKAEAECIAEFFREMGYTTSSSKEDSSNSNDSNKAEQKETSIIYRVRLSWNDSSSQIGAFRNFEYAMRAANENLGYFVFNEDGEIVYPINTEHESVSEIVDLESVARKVIRGDYGNQPERQKRLEGEGYNYYEIQDLVDKMKGKTSSTQDNSNSTKTKEEITAVAKLVLRGVYGNQPERQKRLESEGYIYEEVRAEVNRLYSKI